MTIEHKCRYCGKETVVEGTLEGVSFLPAKEARKFFSKGIYGIRVGVCTECGRLCCAELDTKALKRVITKTST